MKTITKKSLVALAILICFASVSQPAHAGFMDWFNRKNMPYIIGTALLVSIGTYLFNKSRSPKKTSAVDLLIAKATAPIADIINPPQRHLICDLPAEIAPPLAAAEDSELSAFSEAQKQPNFDQKKYAKIMVMIFPRFSDKCKQCHFIAQSNTIAQLKEEIIRKRKDSLKNPASHPERTIKNLKLWHSKNPGANPNDEGKNAYKELQDDEKISDYIFDPCTPPVFRITYNLRDN